ncbi:MAG: HsdR family type I site-specific deoxyribonuclease, partial [Candidatus Ratteibacteria bacterium]|nr:HsdR family type I site-specific deoxyribonuclease [Candidatus Ratteibacteria bacterium]
MGNSKEEKMERFDEKGVIEDYLVERLEEKGWRFVPSDELERESLDDVVLLSLPRLLKKINKNKGIGNEEIRQVLNELKLRSTGIEGNKQILEYLKFGILVKLEKERTVERVYLFDYSHIENNEFTFSRQVYFRNRDNIIRADLILYINGIPIVIIECKSPTSLTQSWFDAYQQIKGYEKTVPELFKYVQIGVAVECLAKYFPIVPWEEDIEIEEWKVEGDDSVGSVIEMLAPSLLLDIIRNFLFFRVKFERATKVLPRYMQYRAANKIVERVLNNFSGKEEKNKGLIWHWQGSGKTFTMIFAAHKLMYLKEMENPTIFFVVDREELEQQLSDEFGFLNITSPERIGSISELERVMRYDDFRGKRGIFITLIQKFSHSELSDLGSNLEKVSAIKQTLQTRKNVVVFIDEGHRTQYGVLASQMKYLLKNAFFFAFTGTPISKLGRDTFFEFSYPPDEVYLDEYFIRDSISDGFIVKIVYQPRLEKDVHLKKEQLDEFLRQELEEIPEEMRKEVEKGVRRKLNEIVMFLENPERIKKICKDIVEHFKENVEDRFKGIIVAGSRKACVLYKKELDKLLPEEYSEVVMTYNLGQEERKSEIEEYYKQLQEKFHGLEEEKIRKTIIEKFKDETGSPKLLIVTEMLLTGFDAPVLQVMYLDKPLKEHRLLQAVARTNRPFKDVKEYGLVIDYIGILEEFKRSLEFYNQRDLKGVFYSTDEMKEEFI